MTTTPHSYIPDAPIEVALYHGYCPLEVRQEAFDAILKGVELGAPGGSVRSGCHRLPYV